MLPWLILMLFWGYIEFSPKEMANKFYEKVSEKVHSIDVGQMKDSVKGGLQSAGMKLSSVWQGIQVPLFSISAAYF